jgi:hypothetical protein
MSRHSQWLFEAPPNLETAYKIYPYSSRAFEEEWELNGTTPEFDGELESIFGSIFDKIEDAVDWGKEQFMVRKAILAGNRDEGQLANLVFFARHPERQGRKLNKSEPNFQQLSREWLEIRDYLVRPALAQSSGSNITPAKNIKWGVPGGVITSPFHRNKEEYIKLVGKSPGRNQHFGIDVSGTRGLPVYATIKPVINLNVLNSVRVAVDKTGTGRTGLGILGQGDAVLKNALVLLPDWNKKVKPGKVIQSWGGVVGLACRYTYLRHDGSKGIFTLYIEYLHLITEDFLPIDKSGNKMLTLEQWRAMGKPIGFGPRMKNKTILSASELTGNNPLLVGYLGATYGPHVHIQANYLEGEKGYKFFPRFDPTVAIA